MLKYWVLIIFLSSILIFQNQVNALPVEQTFITKSETMTDVVFDGKWTQMTEWKHSALLSIYGDRTGVKIRTAHQDNYIYILLDVVIDDLIMKGKDKAIVCFDTKNDKTQIPNNNDYCFTSTLGRASGTLLQGGSSLKQTNYFMNIVPSKDFIAISSPSDEHDRYTSIPHASYEYRIPIELLGRENIYGFYVGVYDADIDKMYTWPENLQTENIYEIPSPSLWGDIISPDKSLPEFPISYLILIICFTLFTIISVSKKKVFLSNL